MNDTIRVLMKRDDLSESEATERFNEVKGMILTELEHGISYSGVEDILASELGLEMDYLFDFIYRVKVIAIQCESCRASTHQV